MHSKLLAAWYLGQAAMDEPDGCLPSMALAVTAALQTSDGVPASIRDAPTPRDALYRILRRGVPPADVPLSASIKRRLDSYDAAQLSQVRKLLRAGN